MIPKIIHYCWLSDDPYPDKIKRCMDSWRRVLPDYEVRLWTLADIDCDRYPWVREAFDARKYAFAADCIRNYALYTHGGIYLDSDVEVLKPFDSLLHLPYFMGYENGPGFIEAAVIGAEPGNPVFRHMLGYYEGRHFFMPDGSYDMLPLPQVMVRELKPYYILKPVAGVEDFDHSANVVSILPYDYFSPINKVHGELQCTDRTIAIHQFAASWLPWHKKIKKIVKNIVGVHFTKLYTSAKRRLKSLTGGNG